LGDDGKTISMVDPGRRWVPILVQDVCGGSAPIPQVWSLSMGVYCLLEVQFQLLVIGVISQLMGLIPMVISIPQLHPQAILVALTPRPLQPPKPKQRAAAAAPRWQEQLVKAEPSALAKPEPAMSIVAAQAGSRWPCAFPIFL
jgi:hypothetical protein